MKNEEQTLSPQPLSPSKARGVTSEGGIKSEE